MSQTETNEKSGRSMAGHWVFAGFMFTYYAVMLFVGLAGYFSNTINSLIYKFDFILEIPHEAIYVRIYSLLLLVLSPSLLLYIAARSPIKMPTAVRIIMFIFGVLAMVVLAFVFDIQCRQYGDVLKDNVLFDKKTAGLLFDDLGMLRLTVGVGIAGIVIFYLISTFSLDADDIERRFLRVIVRITKSRAMLYIMTIFLTLLVFKFAQMVAILIGAWFFIILGIAMFSGGRGGYSSTDKKEYTYTDDKGYSHTVYSNDGKDFYDSTGGYVGHSDDNGKTIDPK